MPRPFGQRDGWFVNVVKFLRRRPFTFSRRLSCAEGTAAAVGLLLELLFVLRIQCWHTPASVALCTAEELKAAFVADAVPRRDMFTEPSEMQDILASGASGLFKALITAAIAAAAAASERGEALRGLRGQ